MNSSPRNHSRRATAASRIALVLALGLAASACVRPKDPGVKIAQLQSNIVFGFELKDKAATPPGVIPDDEVEPADQDMALPEQTEEPEREKEKMPPLPNVQVSCPEAREDAFAERPASVNFEGQALPGEYLWKQEGATRIFAQDVAFSKFGYRQIFDVSQLKVEQYQAGDPIDPTKPTEVKEYTYKVRVPDLLTSPGGNGAFFIDTYKVRQSPFVARAYPPVSPVTTPAQSTSAGDPDRGLSLVKREWFRGNTNVAERTFTPSPGILLLPFPVITGHAFESVGVDPVNGATMVVNGIVGTRKTVDACGEIIDGWEVATTVRFTDDNGLQTSNSYTFRVATQYGAIMTYEALEAAPGTVSAVPKQVYSIGQVRPDPVAP